MQSKPTAQFQAGFNQRACMTLGEAECLARYAKHATASVVELGTACGGSAEILRRNAPEDVPVWSIDDYSWSGSCNPMYIYNGYLSKYTGMFLIVGKSAEVGAYWGRSVSLLFIDADHSYEGVKGDFETWTPWLLPDGFIIFHDAMALGTIYESLAGYEVKADPGVVRFVDEILGNQTWELVETVDTVAVLKRVRA